MRSGRVRVLIGSTQRMGAGMNVQERLIAVHHLTVPWRPCDIEQANGRILRPGNLHPEVYVKAHITQGAFDGYGWQTIERKASFIEAFMAGEVTERTMEDISETVLSAAEIKAIASGNPRVLIKVALEQEVNKLWRMYSAWEGEKNRAKREIRDHLWSMDRWKPRLVLLESAIKLRDEHIGEFSLQVQGVDGTLATYGKREEAGKALRAAVQQWQSKLQEPFKELIAFNAAKQEQGKEEDEESGEKKRSENKDAWALKTQRTDIKAKLRDTEKAMVGIYRGLHLWVFASWSYAGLCDTRIDLLVPEDESVDPVGGTPSLDSDKGVIMGIDASLRNLDTLASSLRDRIASAQREVVRYQAFVVSEWENARTLELKELALQLVNAELSDGESSEKRIACIRAQAEEKGLDLDSVVGAQVDDELVEFESVVAVARLPEPPAMVETAEELEEADLTPLADAQPVEVPLLGLIEVPAELDEALAAEEPERIEDLPAALAPAMSVEDLALVIADRAAQGPRFVRVGQMKNKAKPKAVPTREEDQAKQFTLFDL